MKDNVFSCVALILGVVLLLNGQAFAGIVWCGMAWMTYKE